MKTKDVKSIVSQRIKALRIEQNLTQQEMSDLLGCTQVCYSHYEMGDRSISIFTLIKIAKIHRVSTDYILGLTDDRNIFFWKM